MTGERIFKKSSVLKKFLLFLLVSLQFFSCSQKRTDETILIKKVVKANFEYGYDFNEFNVVRDTIRSGDTFGAILDENHVSQGEIYRVVSKIKDSFYFYFSKLLSQFQQLLETNYFLF